MTYKELKQQFHEELVSELRESYQQVIKDAFDTIASVVNVCKDEMLKQSAELLTKKD